MKAAKVLQAAPQAKDLNQVASHVRPILGRAENCNVTLTVIGVGASIRLLFGRKEGGGGSKPAHLKEPSVLKNHLPVFEHHKR